MSKFGGFYSEELYLSDGSLIRNPTDKEKRLMPRTEQKGLLEAQFIVSRLEIKRSQLMEGDSMIPILDKAIKEHKDMIDKHIDNVIAFSMMP